MPAADSCSAANHMYGLQAYSWRHSITIDTKTATQEIDYLATGHLGLTATSTTTAIVSTPANGNAPIADGIEELERIGDAEIISPN